MALEGLRSSLMRLSLNDGIQHDLVAGIRAAGLRDALRFAGRLGVRTPPPKAVLRF
jgi:hypothetical protein